MLEFTQRNLHIFRLRKQIQNGQDVPPGLNSTWWGRQDPGLSLLSLVPGPEPLTHSSLFQTERAQDSDSEALGSFADRFFCFVLKICLY